MHFELRSRVLRRTVSLMSRTSTFETVDGGAHASECVWGSEPEVLGSVKRCREGHGGMSSGRNLEGTWGGLTKVSYKRQGRLTTFCLSISLI